MFREGGCGASGASNATQYSSKKEDPLSRNTWYNILYDTIVILPPVVGNSIIVQIRRGVANIIIIRFINLLCAMHLAPYSIIIRYRSEL